MLEKMFNYENPVWQFMNRVADIIILNVITIVLSIPVFTIGASWTALYYTTVKMVRKEDTYVWTEYWHSFKSNFKQATKIWLILLPFIAFIIVDLFMWYASVTEGVAEALPKVLKVTTVIVALLLAIESMYVFPVLSHFENTTKKTMFNAFMVSIMNIPSTVLFFIIGALPVVLMLLNPTFIIVDFMFGIAGPAFLCSFAWNKIFKKLEPPAEDEEDDEEDEDKIFSDKPMIPQED